MQSTSGNEDNQNGTPTASERQLRERLLLQNRLHKELLLAENPQTIAAVALRYLRQLVPAQRASVMLVDTARQEARLLAVSNDNNSFTDDSLYLSYSDITFFQKLMRGDHVYFNYQNRNGTDSTLKQRLHREGLNAFLCVPLQARGELVGILNVAGAESNQFDPEHISLTREIAAPIALALYQSELYRTEKEQRLLAETLTETGRILSATLDFEKILDQILDLIGRVVPFETASILMLSGDTAFIARHRGFETVAPEMLPKLNHLHFPIRETPTIRDALSTRAPIVIPDVTNYPGWVHTIATQHIRSWASIPIFIQNELLALICVDNTQPDFYQPHHIERLQAFAGQVGLAWQNAIYHEETTRQVEELRVLHEVAAAGTEAQSEDQYIEQVTHIIGDNLYPDNFGILLLNEAGTYLKLHRSYRMGPHARKFDFVPVTDGIVGRVVREKRPFRHGDVTQLPFYLVGEPATQSELCVPILTGQRVLGVINTESNLKEAFSAADERILATIAGQLATGIDKLRYASQLESRVQERTRELATANERLRELDRLKSKFVADVSHELRTPLTNLSLYLDLFSHAGPEKRTKYLQTLQQQVARLNELVAEILSLSRIELGRETIRFEPVSVNQIVRTVVEAHHPQIANRGLDFEISLAADLPPINGEPNQIAQVITNLLANAIRYTPRGSIELRTWYDSEHEQVCLHVGDTGMGIEETELPYLFQRFYRGQRVSQLNIPGTGLGLAIVQEIIRLHQGTISIKSVPEEKTVVTVTLPAAASAA